MTIPDRVRIFHYVFKVMFVREGDAGGICWETATITIDEDMCFAAQYQTLWHEIVHGWEYALGLDLGEEVVDQLALALCSMKLEFPV